MRMTKAGWVGLAVVGALILAGLLAWAGWRFAYNATTYRAVFLTNGQVYFGKAYFGLTNPLVLHDIYYLQQQTGDTSAANQGSLNNGQIQLIKLGNEIHGPKDVMRINFTQVLFVEDLKSDSQVVKLIEQFKANGNQPPPSVSPSVTSPNPSPSHS